MLDTPHTILLQIAAEHVPAIWSGVSKFIDDAYAAIDETTPDVFKWLINKHGLLWVAVRGDEIVAAATTSLVVGRSGLYCRIVTGGGNGGIDLWKRHIAEIEEYAKREGCVKVRISEGRQGWGRVLTGYVPVTVCLERRL